MKDYPIGGYFELELCRNESFIHDDGVLLNSGRHALEYVLLSLPDVRQLWVPYFTCEVVIETIKKLHIDYSFYHINDCLEIKDAINLINGDYLLYTNYFGIKDEYIRKLVKQYGFGLIVDNAQAWFSFPINGVSTFYSPRKYVGIPDGGVAYPLQKKMDEDLFEFDYSYDRFSHLIKRIDIGPTQGYGDFKVNGQKLRDFPILRMSRLTRRMLSGIDFEIIKSKRISNFLYLHNSLKYNNLFKMPPMSSFCCPMVYPYLIDDISLKKKLIDKGVFVATYWPNVLEWCSEGDCEYSYAKNVCYLPIDQRYDKDDMQRIIELLD